MSKGIKIINGVSKWVRERVGPEAENREQDRTDDENSGDTNGESSKKDSPVCCSAASNSDLTALEQ